MDTRAIPASLKAVVPAGPNRSFLRSKFFWMAVLLIALVVGGIHALRYELRSYVFLIQFLDPHASSILVRLESHQMDIGEITISTAQGPVRARLYVPRGIAHPPGMVLVHGIHHLGIDEPRADEFCARRGQRRLFGADAGDCGSGRLSRRWCFDQHDRGIHRLAASSGFATGPVTVVGVSSRGRTFPSRCVRSALPAPHMRALVLMGAYDDSRTRVARFLATSQAEFPDGRVEPYAAHDYGAAVFVYSHLEQFFPASDLAVAHDALRDWLWERPADAQALFPRLDPASRATIQILIARQIDRLRPQLLDAIQADDSQLSAISPQGKLGALRAPVYLLHGRNRRHYSIHRNALAGKGNSETISASRADHSRIFSRRSRQTCRVDRSIALGRVSCRSPA